MGAASLSKDREKAGPETQGPETEGQNRKVG